MADVSLLSRLVTCVEHDNDHSAATDKVQAVARTVVHPHLRTARPPEGAETPPRGAVNIVNVGVSSQAAILMLSKGSEEVANALLGIPLFQGSSTG